MKAVYLLSQAKDFPGNKRRLWESLDYVRKLWTIIEADIIDPQNRMNKKTKSQLISLAHYVDEKVTSLYRYSNTQTIAGLIEIHQHLAQGLFTAGNTPN